MRVAVTVRDVGGAEVSAAVDYEVAPPVAGGYYLSGNGDVRPDTAGMNLRAVTQYRSFADGSVFPGWQKDYLKTLVTDGVWANYVVELKYYGATVGAQTFTVEGRSYTVPAPSMTIQQRPGTTWPKAYGYSQVLAGQCDGVLHRAAYQLNAMPTPGRINVQLASEFDTDHEFGVTDAGVAYTAAQAHVRAVSALHYMLDYLRAKVIRPGVTFTVGMGGFDRAAWLAMHPETLMAKVDYLQWNVYRRAATETAYDRFMRTKAWSDADLGPVGRVKDALVAEWGTPASLADQAAWIRTVPAAIARINAESTTGRIVATNYFNSNYDWATLDPKDAGLAALRDAYVTSPYA